MKKVLFCSLLFILLFFGNAYPQWVQTMAGNDSTIICCLTDNSGSIFGGALLGQSIFYSENNGASWNQALYNGYLYYSTIAVAAIGNIIFSVAVPTSVNGSVWRSTNNGHNWEGTNLNNITELSSLAATGGYIIAGAYGGVYRSNDSGNTWSSFTIAGSTYIHCLAVDGINLYAGTNHGIYASSNYGASWSGIGLDSCNVYSIAANGSNIFAGIESPYFPSGVFRSVNNGANWSRTTLPDGASAIAISGSNIIAAVNNHGISLSKDNGITWVEKNEGFLYNPGVYDLLIRNNYIYAATLSYNGSGSVWRRELSDIIGIQTISTEIPSKYSLYQNYPNPFNPVTKIKFAIPESGFTTLKIFDALGREVQTLLNEKLSPGTYEAVFNAAILPSGIYLYRIQSGSFTKTLKMTFIK